MFSFSCDVLGTFPIYPLCSSNCNQKRSRRKHANGGEPPALCVRAFVQSCVRATRRREQPADWPIGRGNGNPPRLYSLAVRRRFEHCKEVQVCVPNGCDDGGFNPKADLGASSRRNKPSSKMAFSPSSVPSSSSEIKYLR